MLGGGPQGAPAGGGGSAERPSTGSSSAARRGHHSAGSQDGLPPAASFGKKRLARRPGYMRTAVGPRTGFLSPGVGTLFGAQGVVCGEEHQLSELQAGHCSCGSGSQWPGPPLGSPVSRSTTALAGTPVGFPDLALTPARETSGCFEVQLRAGTSLPDRRTRSCSPGNSGCQGEFPPMDSSEASDLTWDAACGEGARGAWAAGSLAPKGVNSDSCSQRGGPNAPFTPPSSHDVYTSSFSFIRLCLGSAGERGEAEGCPPPREAEAPRQSPEEMKAQAASLERPHEEPRLLFQPFNLKATLSPADSAQTVESSSRQACETLSLLDTDAASSSVPDSLLPGSSGYEDSILGCDHGWDTLIKKYEPVLQDCLLSNRKQLKIKSLRLKLQKLQEKAVEDDDYDKAEKLKQRLEDLEKEKSILQFQLPSRQPALSSFLDHLGAQVQAALCWATQKASSEDTQSPLRKELKLLESTAQDKLHVSITRRDWLLQEKQQLQTEIEALQARMSVLEAKDQQLRREIEEQEHLVQWPCCEPASLVGRLPLGKLQEISKALEDTLTSANQVPFCVEPPETIRSLQERIKSLSLSLKEITAKVCMTERLCSTLRKKVNDIETRLPALLEAKTLAVSGNHFCTAKDLTEEIRSLTSEREGLEGLLSKLLVLSSRNVNKLESIKGDYNRLRRELEHRETAYETTVKENTVQYMEILEDKLCSCKSPLLEKVWEADLEACRLFMQSMQLKEAGGSLSVDKRQTDDLEGAASPADKTTPPRPESEDEKTPLPAAEEWKAHLIPSPQWAGSEQKEESHILSAELGEKCEAIGTKLLYLEDQLHAAIHNHDEDLIQSLKKELQMVKATLQAMILQLQPAKEAGEREAAASCVTAGVRETQA
ncbi:disrupted in schizophrenia 1 protein isoform X2 [Choloepus didactylus]|uniref:disrupted in schizophrenia 1 protein isoform X2 n=1 Tax=Choloepus didactylus TaxID=27675 RepID=UPI0018A0A98E|nr:disrupted in schizophrenia 1 protein isoform X2 [Choloepus didactylus]